MINLDLILYDPQGNVIETSMSDGNSYEFLYCPITESGTYTLEISRYTNNNSSERFALVWY